MVKFTVEPEQQDALDKCVDRALEIADDLGVIYSRGDCEMDLSACHANGNPMDFKALSEANDFEFVHDVWGIRRHLNRKTGELMDCFSPRFSKKEEEVRP